MNEEDFPSIENIPDFATELVFEKNSYPNEMYLDLSRFSQLRNVTIEDGAFANADSFYISNPYMTKTVIGNGCFNGKYDSGRRLEETQADSWYLTHSYGLSIHDGRQLESLNIGVNSMIIIEKIRLIHVKVDMIVQVGTGSLKSITQIEIPVEGSVDEDVETVSQTIVSSIQSGNIEVTTTITVTVFVPEDKEVEVPTYPPIEEVTDSPTQSSITNSPTQSIVTDSPTQSSITDSPTQSIITDSPTENGTQIPSQLPSQPLPTIIPTQPLCRGDLIVSSEDDCDKLLEGGWTTITVNEKMCNAMACDMIISNNPCLGEIVVMKNSLMNLTSLTITNNTQLTRIETIYSGYTTMTGAFSYVKSVMICGITIVN